MSKVPPRLQVQRLSKTFGAAKVLSDVELSVLAGEIHGLAGQNGSGKSTLIKILTGIYTPDPGGGLEVDGLPIRMPVRWQQVHAAGLSVVHQDLGLLDQLSVAENICVGGFPTTSRLRRIDRRRRDVLAAATLERLGVVLDPTRLVHTLTAPERAEVAIARAMRDQSPGSGLVVLDESTRALSGDDLERIHQLLRRITAAGSSVIMISHNLPELMAITDRLTILRDGRLAGTGLRTGELDENDIARRMLGAAVASTVPRSSPAIPANPFITVDGLSTKRLRNLEFSLAKGEIVGITGLPGSGYEDIPYVLTGAQRASAGRVDTNSTSVDLGSCTVPACIRAGIVLVPERRDRDGLAFDQTVQDNISLPTVQGRGRPWFVARKWQRVQAEAAATTLGIRPPTPSSLIKQLSGGNQQKVLLAKWLTTGPKLLVLHEPTQAVDIGARQDILQALQRSADSGVSVLLVSSEPEDIIATCDRILVYDPDRGLHATAATTIDLLIEEIYSIGEPTDGGHHDPV